MMTAKPSIRRSRQQPEAARDGTSSRRARTLVGFLLVCALALATLYVIYQPALRGAMIWDDDVNLTNNATLRSASGLREMWLVPQSTQQYYPLTYTTHWLEYHAWGLDPLGYHVVNILLHALAALLLGRVLTRLGVPGAWLTAALFAVHPVEVESVAWITERKNVLSMVLALMSILVYLRFDPIRGDGDSIAAKSSAALWPMYALSLALYTAALFSKTAVVTLPAVLLVIYWWQRGHITAGDVVRLLPFFAIGIALAVITVQMERAEGEEWTLSLGQRLLLPGRALWFYAAKLFWPQPLIFFYPRQTIDTAVWWQYLYPAAGLGVVGCLWWTRNRIGRGPLAAVLIFAGVLTPALGFFTIYFTRYAYVADHFQYHASAALLALLASILTTAARRFAYQSPARSLSGAAAAVLIAGLATMSWQRAHVYRDPEIFFRDTLTKNPRATIARGNLSGYLQTVGRYDEAIELAREALRTDPQDASAANNLAAALLGRGNRDGFQPTDLDEIFSRLNDALRWRPHFEDAQVNLTFAALAAQRPAEALEHAAAALEINPTSERALLGRGTALVALGRSAEAHRTFELALEQNPDSAPIHYALALALLDERNPAAVEHLERALAIDPRLADAHYALAGVLAGQQEWSRAADHYAAAVQVRPGFARALNNLGVAQINLGRTREAIESFAAAVRANPDYAEARDNLQRAQQAEVAP